MKSLSANEAKTQFGQLLLNAQQAPVEISKNGKPVAVVVSSEEFEEYEKMKMVFLKARAKKAAIDIESDNLVDGDAFFDSLLAGEFD